MGIAGVRLEGFFPDVTQVKRKHGIITQGGQSRPLPEGVEPPQVPPEMETAIEAALRHFHML